MKSLVLAKKQQPIVHVWHNKVTTSSLTVAEYFGKSHPVVLRSIRNLECSQEFSRCNFAQRDYVDDRGKKQPCYELTKDGFAMLAFSFTGKQAAVFKERYISAFNEMLEGYPDGRLEAVQSKRLAHIGMTDAIKHSIETRGKEAKPYHYMRENKLCNWAIRGEFKSIDESTLLAGEAKLLERVRNYNETLLLDGIEYDVRKKKLEAYAVRQRAYLMPKVALLECAA